MCGITGVWRKEQEVDTISLLSLGKRVKHRGPDAEGTYVSSNKKLGLYHSRF